MEFDSSIKRGDWVNKMSQVISNLSQAATNAGDEARLVVVTGCTFAPVLRLLKFKFDLSRHSSGDFDIRASQEHSFIKAATVPTEPSHTSHG